MKIKNINKSAIIFSILQLTSATNASASINDQASITNHPIADAIGQFHSTNQTPVTEAIKQTSTNNQVHVIKAPSPVKAPKVTKTVVKTNIANAASNNLTQAETTSTDYRIVEIKEGEFQQKNSDGTDSNNKYSAYFVSLESEGGEDEDSYKLANYNYIGIKAGAVMPDNLGGNSPLSGNSTKNTSTIGFFAGRKFMDRFAVELEFMFRKGSDVTATDTTGQTVNSNSWGAKSNTLMLNLAIDIVKGRMIRPYVKGGIGIAHNDAEDFTINSTTGGTFLKSNTYVGKTTNEFAWQAGAGLNMIVNQTFDINLEYMYVDRGKIKTEAGYAYVTPFAQGYINQSAFNGKLIDNVITAGLKIKF